jgi:hypothetical protein
VPFDTPVIVCGDFCIPRTVEGDPSRESKGSRRERLHPLALGVAQQPHGVGGEGRPLRVVVQRLGHVVEEQVEAMVGLGRRETWHPRQLPRIRRELYASGTVQLYAGWPPSTIISLHASPCGILSHSEKEGLRA